MLTDAALLELWTCGQALGGFARGNLLVRGLSADEPVEDLSLGRRNAILLRFHAESVGSQLEGQVACPACSKAVEFAVPVRTLLAAGAPGPVEFEHGGRKWTFRPARVGDVSGAAASRDGSALMRRCLADPVGSEIEDPSFVTAFAVAMTQADPLAEIRLALVCALCQHAWEELLEPGRFAWERVDRGAAEVLESVYTLAARFGWTEGEVLALPPVRRKHYARMVTA